MSNIDFIECCHILTKLAILKGVKKEESEIAYLSKFLLSEISIENIKIACSFFARRKDRFPDASDFYNLMVPMIPIDEIAEDEVSGLINKVRNNEYDKESFSQIQRDLLDKWSWSSLKECSNKDMNAIRISMVFYLKSKLSNDGKTKILLNKQAFDKYKLEVKNEEQNLIE